MQIRFPNFMPISVLLVTCISMVFLVTQPASAETNDGFKIQASPSPLVLTLTPGQSQTTELTIRNFGGHTETLHPILRSFTTSSDSKTITINGSAPADISSWVTFGQNHITVNPGSEQKLPIRYQVPATAGFSYSFAILLEREQQAAQTPGAATFEASIAVFNLLNINRADAKASMSVDAFQTDKKRYEFLPISFSVKTHNAGNVIGRPTGTIFIQRNADDATPIATLPINDSGGYILPDKSRAFTSTWDSGFPRFVTIKASESGNPSLRLEWNWKELNQVRIGHYVAKAVVVYNDGSRDVPLVVTHGFWVMPWRLLGILLGITLILLAGLAAIFWQSYKLFRKVRRRA